MRRLWRQSGSRPAYLAWTVLLLVAAHGHPEKRGHAENLSRQLLADAADGRLDELEFALASLIASGVENSRALAAWRDPYRTRRQEIVAAATMRPHPSLPEALHAELHERVLTGRYAREASDVRLALAGGNYNCLSALALYFDCCTAAGLDVEIRLRRGHVSARFTDGHWIDVEPSAPHWRASAPCELGDSTRRISPLELLGKFYYNRGVERLEERRFEEGLALLEISAQLDPDDEDARGNLVAGLNNWAVARLQSQQYAEAALLIDRGLARDAAFVPLLANQRLVRALLGKKVLDKTVLDKTVLVGRGQD